MLIFIDESGNPHPNDRNHRPVVVAVCIDAEDSRAVSSRLSRVEKRYSETREEGAERG